MERITLNIELNSRPDRTNRWSVMVRMHMKGEKPARMLLSVKLDSANKYWNPKKTWGKWVVKHDNKEKLNSTIKKEYNQIEQQIYKWQDEEPDVILTPVMLARRFKNPVRERYFDLVNEVLEELKEQAYATYLAKRTVVNAFREFVPDENLPLKAVTIKLCQQFQDYLKKGEIKHMPGQKKKGSTVNKMFDRMHNIHKRVLIKTGLSAKQAYYQSPWTDIEPLPEIKPRKGKLTEETIQAVAKVQVESKRRRVTPELAFHMWLLSHAFAGMRFSDIMQLRYKHFDLDESGQPVHLRYEMLKTGNRVSIPVFDEGRILLKRYWKQDHKPTDYILPYLKATHNYAYIVTNEQYKTASFEVKRRLYNDLVHWNRQVNLCLREIEEKAGLPEKLRMHNARHSFAEMARSIMQKDKSITVYDIQLMLGHSSFKTTEGYYNDSSSQDSTEAMKAVFKRKNNN